MVESLFESLNIALNLDFVNYGQIFEPAEGVLVLDVGMKTVPGVIDHHHSQAEPECAASLIAAHPELVLNHIPREKLLSPPPYPLQLITHRLPDFDGVASIFLSLKLLEQGCFDKGMKEIAAYTRLVDSASLPKTIDLCATPYSILRALFAGRRQLSIEAKNIFRVNEGVKFINFLYSRLMEGYDILENRVLFSSIDRYEEALHKAENDYFNYLLDVQEAEKMLFSLPLTTGSGKKSVDGLVTRNPRSFLLKDWARRDKENPSLGSGFTLLFTNYTDKRIIIGVDPEMNVTLHGLGDLLNEAENEKRRQRNRPFPFPWYAGNCPFFNYRIVDSPQDGTMLSHEEVVAVLRAFSDSPD